MTWEGIGVIVAIGGLFGHALTMFVAKVRSEGTMSAGILETEKRQAELEGRISEVERRVHHCEKNIAVLDERTRRE